MSKQSIYDEVMAHLRQQKKPAINKSVCAYRAPDGSKCAIGALIPDDMYSSSWEGLGVSLFRDRRKGSKGHRLYQFLLEKAGLMADSYDSMKFLRDLQGIHDYSAAAYENGDSEDFLEDVEKNAKRFALDWKLTYTPPEKEDV